MEKRLEDESLDGNYYANDCVIVQLITGPRT
jgi:hypothetical protein